MHLADRDIKTMIPQTDETEKKLQALVKQISSYNMCLLTFYPSCIAY